MTGKRRVTRGGLARLEERLSARKQRLAALLAEKGDAATTGGDAWHDNFSFEQLEAQERSLRRQIADLRHRIAVVEVIENLQAPDGIVAIGSEVDVRFDDGVARTLRIVGHGESDPPAGLVAYDAPLGVAVLGAHVNDARELVVGRRRRRLTVEAIR